MKDSPVLSDSELGNLFCARKLDCDRMLYMAGSREIFAILREGVARGNP